MIRHDYAPSGPNLRRALARKALALDREHRQRVLCDDPYLPSDRRELIWKRISKVIGAHVRTAEDCQ